MFKISILRIKEMETIKLEDLNDLVIEKIARQCPQLKLIIDVDIEDVRKYGYEFPFGNDETETVKINGREYTVKKSPLARYKELVKLYECQTLSPTQETIKKIYDCYCEILKKPIMLSEAMKCKEFACTYDGHKNGGKIFLQMDIKHSIVAAALFYLYH